jgi:hypothetical protein
VGTEDVLPWAFCVFFGDQACEPPSDTLNWPLHDSAAPRQTTRDTLGCEALIYLTCPLPGELTRMWNESYGLVLSFAIAAMF